MFSIEKKLISILEKANGLSVLSEEKLKFRDVMIVNALYIAGCRTIFILAVSCKIGVLECNI